MKNTDLPWRSEVLQRATEGLPDGWRVAVPSMRRVAFVLMRPPGEDADYRVDFKHGTLRATNGPTSRLVAETWRGMVLEAAEVLG